MNKFDRDFKRAGSMIWILFVINTVLSVGVIGGFVWLVYVLLKHFGIVG